MKVMKKGHQIPVLLSETSKTDILLFRFKTPKTHKNTSLLAQETQPWLPSPYHVLASQSALVSIHDLGPEDQHLLFADLKLLIGQLELVQQKAVAVWGAGDGVVLHGLVSDSFPQLIQVVLQLLVL